MEKARARLNSAAGQTAIGLGGAYIQYPDILNTPSLFLPDGVHLTTVGNTILLNTIQGVLGQFHTRVEPVYPWPSRG